MIAKDKIVKICYDLYVDGRQNSEEELMERAPEEHPLVYCHGRGMMLPMFEESLTGKTAGEMFDFRIPAKDAYGEYDDEALLTLNKELFYIDGKFDEERVFVGNIVPMTTAEGQIINAQIAEISDDSVTIDLNHPLAGENLHFKGKVIEVRDATEEELQSLTKKCGGCCGGGCSGNDCDSDCTQNNDCHCHNCK